MLLQLANSGLVASAALVKGVCEGPEYKQVKEVLLLIPFEAFIGYMCTKFSPIGSLEIIYQVA